MSGQDEIDRSEQRAVDAEAREADTIERADAREAEALGREGDAVARESAMASVLPGIQQALTGLDETMRTLIDRLDAVTETSEEIGEWRRKATWAMRGLVVSLTFVAVMGAVVAAMIWRDGVQRTNESSDARQANCRATEDAFDRYTNLLIDAVNGTSERTPEEQEKLDARADAFRAAVRAELGECA